MIWDDLPYIFLFRFVAGAKVFSARTIKVKEEEDIRYYMIFELTL